MRDRLGVFGIVNVTEDSFSDGGLYLDPEQAISHAKYLAQAGADVIDLGPASSHPDAGDVSPQGEIDRLSAIVPALRDGGLRLSLDSFHPETQIWAIEQGFDWLNDINGFSEPDIYPQLAKSSCQLVVMHSIQSKGKARRIDVSVDDIWPRIFDFFEARMAQLEQAGIDRNRLVLDPGMGFFLGTDPDVSLTVLAGISKLKSAFSLPVLVSVTRKSFLRNLSGRDVANSGPISLAAELWAIEQGVDYIRTHDVAQLHDAVRLRDQLTRFS